MKTNFSDIVRFFLKIYKNQLHVPGGDSRFVPISRGSRRSDAVYELQTDKGKRVCSRRMSISPLGEDTGSKSTCFKVIYDNILVVKIPPRPILNFEKYIDGIRNERRIADILSKEIECITPSLSAILKKLPLFSRYAFLDPRLLEKRCIEQLRAFPEYMDHIRIGDTFAYFSNLSRYSFLGQIIRDMHYSRERVLNEILSQMEMLEHPALFEDQGNRFPALIFYRIGELYSAFEEKFALLVNEMNLPSIQPYKKKVWFMTHLAEKAVEEDDEFGETEFISRLNVLIREVLETDQTTVGQYRKSVKVSIRERNFRRNRAQMRGIITNLLTMLALLRKNGVAMRDLKPDNVFVAGDVHGNPVLLATPQDYTIGLIDFETAVLYRPRLGGKIRQPMLAGTPSYATPSHLFRNELLTRLYPDPGRIFHLQDWQAVCSMMFNVVKGKRLSKKTRGLIPEIIQKIRIGKAQNLTDEEVYQASSRLFWQEERSEFFVRLTKNQASLRSVRLPLPETARQMFLEEARTARRDIAERIRKVILSQPYFVSEQSRSNLLKAGRDILSRHREKWEDGSHLRNSANISPAVRKRIVTFLEILERMKSEAAANEEVIQRVKTENAAFSVYEVMIFMNRVIFNAMFVPEWGALGETPQGEADVREVFEKKDTVAYRDTVEIEKTLER